MADWQPNPDTLRTFVELLTQASDRGDTQTQRYVMEQMNMATETVVDFACYLAYILVHMKEQSTPMRQLAGLQLKNYIRNRVQSKNYGMHDAIKAYVYPKLIEILADSSSHIRATASTCITAIIDANGGVQGFKMWPGLFDQLFALMDSQQPEAVEGALSCIYKLCEDHPTALDDESIGRPLNTIIPRLIQATQTPSEAVKKNCLRGLFPFVVLSPQALLVNMDAFLQMLFRLAEDESKEVRRRCCQAIVSLTENKLHYLMPYMEQVVEYMFQSTQEQDEFVALEACDFWNALCSIDQALPLLQRNLNRLVPVLLRGMVYSEIELCSMGTEATQDNCDVEDRPQDIKPFVGGGMTARTFVPSEGKAQPGDESDDDFGDEEDMYDDGSGQWNFRRCSASALDHLAVLLPNEVIAVLLPQLNAVLGDPNVEWRFREASVLALGAIAEGCMDQMGNHLPGLFPYLQNLAANDQMPLVRSISLWTLGRYSGWASNYPVEQFVAPTVEVFLGRMLDRNKRVQEAACSALATQVEQAQTLVNPLVPGILPVFQRCFEFYKARNLILLYDAIGTLCDNVNTALRTPEYATLLLGPLVKMWNTIPDDSPELTPLLECLHSAAPPLGPLFGEFAPAVYERMVRIIQKELAATEEFYAGKIEQPPTVDVLPHAIDLLSALCDALGGSIESLVGQSTLPALMPSLATHPQVYVLTSTFGLIGDLSRNAYPHIQPHIGTLAIELAKNVWPPENQTVSVNAVWALGELALRAGDAFANSINQKFQENHPSVLEALCLILDGNFAYALMNNAAITLGRFAMYAPQLIVGHIGETFRNWLIALNRLPENQEKDNAFRGMCEVVKANPQAVVPHFPHMCQAISSWSGRIAPDLNENFRAILVQFKGAIGAGWDTYYGNFPPELRQTLTERYQI